MIRQTCRALLLTGSLWHFAVLAWADSAESPTPLSAEPAAVEAPAEPAAPQPEAAPEAPLPPATVAPAPPAAPGPAAATEPAPPQPGPATTAVPGGTTSTSGAPRILILPAEFTVYQHGAASLEPVPKWTDDARRNLAESARRVLAADGRFTIIDTPQIPPDREADLREHIELFKVIGSQLNGVVKVGGSAWEATRNSADYRIGPGLQFLKQQTGADFAFVIAGAEVRQTGGSIFMQVLLAAAGVVAIGGGGTYMFAGIIDLETGRVTWFGSQTGIQAFGMGGGADARSSSGADDALGKILKAYPRTVGLDLGSGLAR
jgi:hypothetical protein